MVLQGVCHAHRAQGASSTVGWASGLWEQHPVRDSAQTTHLSRAGRYAYKMKCQP